MNAWSKMSYQCGDCVFFNGKTCDITFKEVSAQKMACRSFDDK
jgi:hypothetical protein